MEMVGYIYGIIIGIATGLIIGLNITVRFLKESNDIGDSKAKFYDLSNYITITNRASDLTQKEMMEWGSRLEK